MASEWADAHLDGRPNTPVKEQTPSETAPENEARLPAAGQSPAWIKLG